LTTFPAINTKRIPAILCVVALMIWRDMGAPVLFRQTRPGRHGKPFQMVKFRTMRDALDASGNPLPDSERLTRLGRFLRSSSIDEIPEFWNVLKGDMSLVGPRPLLMEYHQGGRMLIPVRNSDFKHPHWPMFPCQSVFIRRT
jgi:lipopolysaccharide/colanic/teichoic acid biosynthesis glycosyltransferase